MLLPLPLRFHPSNCRPAPNRWTRRALILALASLLLSCASPCQPTADPARLERLIEIHPTPGLLLDGEIGINCAWRF